MRSSHGLVRRILQGEIGNLQSQLLSNKSTIDSLKSTINKMNSTITNQEGQLSLDPNRIDDGFSIVQITDTQFLSDSHSNIVLWVNQLDCRQSKPIESYNGCSHR